jgi:hypothetical protein
VLADLNRKFDGIGNATNTTVKPGLLPTQLAKAFRGYADDLHKITGHRISGTQTNGLKKALQDADYSKPLSKSKHAAHRAEFDKAKAGLRKEWEANTGQKWPTYGSNAPKGRNPDSPWDAHELIPNQNGGPIKWWNITPARFPDQHQKLIHGKGGAYEKLLKNIGN